MSKQDSSNNIWIGLSFLIVGLSLGLFLSNLSGDGSGMANLFGSDEVQKDPIPLEMALDDVGPSMGSADAPVTMIEFSDYECPYCSTFVTEVLPLIKENYIDTGKVRLVYKDFPLKNIHPNAAKAGEAAQCVYLNYGDEAYFEMHDRLFETQALWSGQPGVEQNFVNFAGDLGYDIASCLASGEEASTVEMNFQMGLSNGITGTPSFFINDRSLVGAQDYALFEAYIEAELAEIQE